ncbi:MAG: RHS repeat-associated core domain-containing protein [Planctomycetia bacterium]|nr:RHS repeat-associated core domain-containing protein [Planctomycetia bacterium]
MPQPLWPNLDRLTEFRRGALSDADSDGVLDTVTTAGRQQAWTLDALGNWDSLQGNGGTPVDRDHNAQNQITSNNGASLTYDADGNLRTSAGVTNTYDAWNRLYSVSIANGRYFLHDALGRRIHEFSAADNIQYGAGGPYQRTNLYYSADWRVLEEDSNNDAQDRFTQVQNVWSPLYIDAMVLRDTEITESGGGEGRSLSVVDERLQRRLELLRADPRFAFAAGVPRPKIVEKETNGTTTRGGIIPPAPMNVPTVAGRVYVEQDANWNVTSITDTSGTVVERYVYDPYGTSTRLTASWGTAGTDAYVMAWRHQGGRQDAATGLVHFRHRDLDTGLGRWVQQDIGYLDGSSLYLYGLSSAPNYVDPLGREVATATAATGTAVGGTAAAPVVGGVIVIGLACYGAYCLSDWLTPAAGIPAPMPPLPVPTPATPPQTSPNGGGTRVPPPGPGDPECDKLEAAIRKLVNELKDRIREYNKNKDNLPEDLPPEQKTRGKTTRKGHRERFNNQRVNLQRQISQFKDRGCTNETPPDTDDLANHPGL